MAASENPAQRTDPCRTRSSPSGPKSARRTCRLYRPICSWVNTKSMGRIEKGVRGRHGFYPSSTAFSMGSTLMPSPSM